MLHRPLRRPLAVVSLLALADYLLWDWSLGGSHGVIGLVAGLTLVPLLIAVAWLLVVGATRVLVGLTRHTRTISSARASAAGARLRAATGARRRGASGASAGGHRPAVAARSASGRSPIASTDAGEASSQISPSSKLAA